jgi:hypothetical protein
MPFRLSRGFAILCLSTGTALATGIQVPFDRVYPVAAPGSREPVTQFDINGPAPWVYLDLPSPGGQYSYGSSNWFAGGSTTMQFQEYSPGIFVSDGEYWLSPPADGWAQLKSVGDWRVDASFAWWDLVIIYGGGAPVTKTFGSQSVHFSMMNTGDANGDGRVDIGDLGLLASSFNRPGDWSHGDFTNDGMVDVADLGILASNWGFGTGGGSQPFAQAAGAFGVALPEPGLAWIGPMGALTMVHRRRRRDRTTANRDRSLISKTPDPRPLIRLDPLIRPHNISWDIFGGQDTTLKEQVWQQQSDLCPSLAVEEGTRERR